MPVTSDRPRRGWLRRLHDRLVIWPMRPAPEPPPKPPSGGPIETVVPGRVYLVKDGERPPLPSSLGVSLDALPPAEGAPIIGYMSRNGFKHIRDIEGWSSLVCRDPGDLVSKYGLVEVEIRFRRIVGGA